MQGSRSPRDQNYCPFLVAGRMMMILPLWILTHIIDVQCNWTSNWMSHMKIICTISLACWLSAHLCWDSCLLKLLHGEYPPSSLHLHIMYDCIYTYLICDFKPTGVFNHWIKISQLWSTLLTTNALYLAYWVYIQLGFDLDSLFFSTEILVPGCVRLSASYFVVTIPVLLQLYCCMIDVAFLDNQGCFHPIVNSLLHLVPDLGVLSTSVLTPAAIHAWCPTHSTNHRDDWSCP